MIADPCATLSRQLGALFECREQGQYIRVRTPYLYPDGDMVDVFFSPNEDPPCLTDLGETLRWLALQATSDKRTPKQQALIHDVCLTLGVELYKGMLQKRVRAEEELAGALMNIAQAAVRVSDLWFTFRSRSFDSINDEVAEFLENRKVSFDRGVSLVGRSGNIWRVDFQARVPQQTSLVNVLSTGNRAAARKLAEHTLATWYDLSNYKVGPEGIQFVSLFDDTLDVWGDEDFRLLEDLSEVAFWSKPEELALKLAA
jgi:hypothetical protein